jgi:hypothetical protein
MGNAGAGLSLWRELAIARVPKNIKGVKAVDGTKCLIFSAYVFWRGTVWNTFWPIFGLFFIGFGTVWNTQKRVWNTSST